MSRHVWLAACSVLALQAPCWAQAQAAPPHPAPRARATSLTVPLYDGAVYLGDITLTAEPGEGSTSVSAARLSQLLAPLLGPAGVAVLDAALAGRARVETGPLGPAGFALRYQPDRVALVAEMPVSARASSGLAIAPTRRPRLEGLARPASVSAYLTARGVVTIADGETQGSLLFDGAARFGGVVLESDGSWRFGRDGGLRRHASRLVIDDPDRALRFTAGDLVVASRGFQSAPAMAGLSLIRSYGLLQPQAIVRPGGRSSFILDRPALVDILVNGQLTRRAELQPGRYDLTDFPFAQGANDVSLLVRDEAGHTERIRFDTFFDQSQLAPGLNEFALFAGLHAPPGISGPHYGTDWVASLYYRHGLSNQLTAGAGFQADAATALLSGEAVLATAFGTFRLDAAISRGQRSGAAAALSFQRLLRSRDGAIRAFSLSIEGSNAGFRPVGPDAAPPPFAWRASAEYSHAFSPRLSASVAARMNQDRTGRESQAYRAAVNWAIGARGRLMLEASHDDAIGGRRDAAIRIGLFASFGARSVASVDHDSASRTTRLSVAGSGGNGAGAYNLLGEVERGANGTGLNLDAHVETNRAELGASRFTNLAGGRRSVTSLRFGSAIAFADGALAIGRPIRDSFAIVGRHRSHDRAQVDVDPLESSYTATTGRLGTALRSDLSAYFERTLTIHSPDARADVDLGRGSFRLMPPYRSGYRLVVGSDYSISVSGRLLGVDGQPLALVAGHAREEGGAQAEVGLFTNAEGRFGAYGLRGGRWRLRLGSDPVLEYLLVIPATALTTMRVGELRPEQLQ